MVRQQQLRVSGVGALVPRIKTSGGPCVLAGFAAFRRGDNWRPPGAEGIAIERAAESLVGSFPAFDFPSLVESGFCLFDIGIVARPLVARWRFDLTPP